MPEPGEVGAAQPPAATAPLPHEPRLIEFYRAPLRQVLRFLATQAGIPFIALPEDEKPAGPTASAEAGFGEGALVTFSMRTTPLQALEIIAKANGVALIRDPMTGVVSMRALSDRQLIGKTYPLRYNSQDNVVNKGQAGAGVGATTQTSQTSGGVADIGISLAGAPDVFKVEEPQVVKSIRTLLEISGETTVGVTRQGAAAEQGMPAALLDETQVQTQGNAVSGGRQQGQQEQGGAQVVWNSDSNTLFVVATRQQHEWVEQYLRAADSPQNLIAIEVKFFETTKDPRKQLGLDWSGTLADGYAFGVRGVGTNNLTAPLNYNLPRSADAAGGEVPTVQQLPTLVNPYLVAEGVGPFTAVLSADQVQVRIRAFLADRDTQSVSYPRVLTVNNKEVVIRSVVNEPVLASSSTVNSGGTGTTANQVSYLPIGTTVNVLPKAMQNKKSIGLNVVVTVSDLLTEKVIQGNPYPVTASRIYNAALQVTSGYTLAIGGLQEAKDRFGENSIPWLGKIPVVGWAFKSKVNEGNRRNLMIFITPTLLPSRSLDGLPPEPESTIPVRPGQPKRPQFASNGRLVGGSAGLDNALRWLEFRYRYYFELVQEKRQTDQTIQELEDLAQLTMDIMDEAADLRAEEPQREQTLTEQIAWLENFADYVNRLRVDASRDRRFPYGVQNTLPQAMETGEQ